MGLTDFLQEFLDRSVLPEELRPFADSDIEASAAASESSELEDFVVDIGRVYDDQAFSVDEEEGYLKIDPERGDWESSKSELKSIWESNDRVFTEDAFELYLSIQAHKGDVEEVCSFFEPPVLTHNQHQMLEEAYHTSIYFSEFNISHDEEDRRRRQLGEDYGEIAMNLPSLCSAGYFNQGGLFREVYTRVQEDYDNPEEKFQEVFNTLVTHRPFVVFVKGTHIASEIYDLVIRKSIHLDQIDVDIEFIHIRGIGPNSREKIQTAMGMLEKNHGNIRYTSDNSDESGEFIVALDHSTL